MRKFQKLDVPYQWKDEFTKYPHGYTIFEALCSWTKQVDSMVDNVNNWNDYLDNFVEKFEFELQEEIKETLSRWQDDGFLENIINQAINTRIDDVAIYVDDFGAVGDGVTSDSIAFQNAIEKAMLSKKPTIALTSGKTYLLKSNDVDLYPCISILGNGATLKLDGVVRFSGDSKGFFNLSDITVQTNFSLDENATNKSGFTIFTVGESVVNVNNVLIESIDNSPLVTRYPTCFAFVKIKDGSKIDSVVTKSMAISFTIHEGENYTMSNISGYNSETLIHVAESRNIAFDNCTIRNTFEESITWLGKVGMGSGVNGKNVILLERVEDVVMSNITGEFCIERVLYCQASNVVVNNVTAINCWDGVKFCGSPSRQVKNVTAKNIVKIINDEMVDISAYSSHQLLLQSYYIDDLYIDGLTLKNHRTNKLNETDDRCILLMEGVNNLHLNNVDVDVNITRSLFLLDVYANHNIKCSNWKFTNVKLRNHGHSDVESYILQRRDSRIGDDWINGLVVEGFEVVQTTEQIMARNIGRNVRCVYADNIDVTNVDSGFLQSIPQPTIAEGTNKVIKRQSVVSSYLANSTFQYNNAGYFNTNNSYIEKGEYIYNVYPYIINSDMGDIIKIVYSNHGDSPIRYYNSVDSVFFNVKLSDVYPQYKFPINVIDKSYMVEVASELGYGKAIFTGTNVTEIYKFGECTFDNTANKLQITTDYGVGADRCIKVNNATGVYKGVSISIQRIS